ncbi:MAG: response regulator [Phycisphaerales bacterium]|nr:response regulator [Phycisphaerales bacterium]MCB9856496.1 response regulator [Phycisphaerales bacterium]MCB9863977.1 response regulator [Phycisphaerales bacterium]
MSIAPPDNTIELTNFSLWDMIECGRRIRLTSKQTGTFVDAAESLANYFYDAFRDRNGDRAVVLSRVFKTHRYADLDDELKAIAQSSMNAGETPFNDMNCLTLLATRGDRPEWDDRRRSMGHRAIAMKDAEALNRAPMIDGMIDQFGIKGDLYFLDSASRPDAFIKRQFGVFHVPDARGSKWVPSQEQFVIPNGIGSVLAFGGALPSGNVFSVILFLRVRVSAEVAELFQPLALSVKLALWEHSEPLKLFDSKETEKAVERVRWNEVADERVPGLASIRDHVIEETLEVQESVVMAIASRLKDTTARLQSIMDAATTVGIYAADVNGLVTHFNSGAERLLGYQASEIVGRVVPTHWHDRDELSREVVRWTPDCGANVADFEVLVSGARRGDDEEREWTFVRKNGSRVPVNLKTSIILGEHGDPMGFLWIATDISAQKQFEIDIRSVNSKLQQQADYARRMAAAAEQANDAKSAFLANMSHELRTPLTAILGYSEWLVDGGMPCDAAGDAHAIVHTILRNGRHLLQLINDILDLSKIEAGRLTVEQLDLSPAEMLIDVESLMRERASAKSVNLSVNFLTPIPDRITSDPTRLRQILINLIGNAIKFTMDGEVRVDVELIEDADEPQLSFNVVDTGIGMSEDQLKLIFNPFVQADSSTTRKFGGTGLGLAVSKRLAEVLGGDISVQSTVGEGSAFALRIPAGNFDRSRMVEAPQEAEAGPMPDVRVGSSDVLRDVRILLAEDGADNQRLLSLILRKAGADVTVVGDGRKAVDSALAMERDGIPFDAILMDMQMPVLDGYGATRELRNADYEYPIVALTANAMGGDRERCIEAGCDDYVTKPIDRPRLLETVRSVVSNSRAAAATRML